MRAANTIANADAEIARFKEIMRQIDELEMEFDKVRHIRDIVKAYRSRVEGISNKLGRRWNMDWGMLSVGAWDLLSVYHGYLNDV